jgi:DNA-binding response OmpR family regulator
MRRILLVEDEDLLREGYFIILSLEPYETYLAANGQEALDLCDKYNFDLILLDLMMPIMNGVEFMKEYAKEDREPTKIIILSNLSFGDELKEAMDLGAHKSVLKADLSPKQLVALVRYEVESGQIARR